MTQSGTLERHALFRGTRHERIAPFLPRAVVRTVAKGSMIHAPGEQSQALYLLLDGGLRAYQLTADGRKLILEIMEPGGWDGLLPLLGQRGHFTEAAENSLVACFDWAILDELFRAEPRVMRNLVELVAERLESREEHLESMVIR